MPQYVRLHIVFILWLQLWPPLKAVVNELASLLARDAMAKLSALSQGEIGYSTYDPALDEIVLHQAAASYLLVLVPLLAYYLAKGTDFAGAILAARFLQPSEGFVAQQSRGRRRPATGRCQVNLSPTLHHGAPLAHRVDQGGSTLTRTESGRQYLELGSRLTAAAQGAQTEVLSSAYAEGFDRLRSRVDSSALGKTHQGRDLASERRGHSIIRTAHEDLSSEAGGTREESARALGTIAANLGLGINVFKQRAGLDASANVSKTVMERSLDSVRGRLGESESRGIDDVRSFAREYARSEEFRAATMLSSLGSERTGEEFHRAHQLATEAGAYLSRSSELSDQARQSERHQLSVALDLLRNQSHIGLEAARHVREHLAQGGGMERARKIAQEELEKSGLFSVDIDGQAVTPADLAARAQEAFARVGQDAPAPHRTEPLPGVESPSDPETLKQAVRDEIERTEESASAPAQTDGTAIPRAIPPVGSRIERVVTRFGEAVSRELGPRNGKERTDAD